ncbi:ribosome silencing factor [Marinicella sp. W31]|uniref:ribosome silencing factor n=1 Tax=Marinicella sp. W31 TaxID=3023713 RepID=UPI003757B739
MQKIKQLTEETTKAVHHIILESLEDAKAQEITVLDVSHLTSITDHMIICNGTSARHMHSMAKKVIDAIRESGFHIMTTEGFGSSDWLIVDCGDAVVHIMSKDSRGFYHLEGLWDIKLAAE